MKLAKMEEARADDASLLSLLTRIERWLPLRKEKKARRKIISCQT